MKFLIDEDLSPQVAIYLCRELLVDAVSVRDRGLLGADDRRVFQYAFTEDRILITANVSDFETFVNTCEIHAGIIFILEGDLLRHEQILVVKEAVQAIKQELERGEDMINRVLYISIDGDKKFAYLPKNH